MQQLEKDTPNTLGEYYAPVCPMLSCLSLIPRYLRKLPLALLIFAATTAMGVPAAPGAAEEEEDAR